MPILIATINPLWYIVPLIISTSLVYGATRDERMGPILQHALRFGSWVVGFVVVIFVILLFASWSV